MQSSETDFYKPAQFSYQKAPSMGGRSENGFGHYGDDAVSVRSGRAESESGWEPGKPISHKASKRVATLVGDVKEIEQHCQWLEKRNAWLTDRLLASQKGFIERMMGNSAKAQLVRVWDGWTGLMNELRLEKQLFQLNNSLEQVQRMGKDCSAALEKEQALKDAAESALLKADEEVKRLQSENQSLRRQIEADTHRMTVLERRLSEAETSLFRSHKDAQNVIEAVSTYNHRSKELQEGAETPLPPGPIEISKQSQQNAAYLMSRMGSVLEPYNEGKRAKKELAMQNELRSPMYSARNASPMTRTMVGNGYSTAGNAYMNPQVQYMSQAPSFGRSASGAYPQERSISPLGGFRQIGAPSAFQSPAYGFGGGFNGTSRTASPSGNRRF